MKEKTFMQYFCKNPECGAIFIAEDLCNRKKPETWRYCPDCEAKGFPVIRQDPDLEKNRNSNANNIAKYWKAKKLTTANKNRGVLPC